MLLLHVLLIVSMLVVGWMMELKYEGQDDISVEASPMYAQLNFEVDGVNLVDAHGNTPLLNAVQSGAYEAVKYLIQGGADVNVVNKEGESPLFIAAKYGFYHSSFEILKSNPDLNYRAKSGMTALLISISTSHHEIAIDIINKGAIVDMSLPSGLSPLMMACQNQLNDVVKSLLDHNANVHLMTMTGETAMMYAGLVDNIDAMKLLLGAGASLSQANKRGITTLMLCVSRNAIHCVRWVLNQEPSTIHQRNIFDQSALAIAVEQGATQDVIEELVIHGANLENMALRLSPDVMKRRKDYLTKANSPPLKMDHHGFPF